MSYAAPVSAKGDTVTVSTTEAPPSDVYFDPYDVDINADPYPTFRRLRDEVAAVLQRQHDFYALSRFADVNKALVDHETFSSARGAIIELIKAEHRDPAGHRHFRGPADSRHPPQAAGEDVHAAQGQRARAHDPGVLRAEPRPAGRRGAFDFVADLGAQMPMKVISALLGIPEDDQEMIRDHANAQLRTEAGKPMKHAEDGFGSRRIYSRPTSTGAPTTRPTTS